MLGESDDYIDRVLGASHTTSLIVPIVVLSVIDVVESMILSLVAIIIGSQIVPSIEDTKMIDEYVLIDPYMVDGVPLSTCISKYKA